MKKKYVILGDNNFWYTGVEGSLQDAENAANDIINDHTGYGDGKGDEPVFPGSLYIFEAKEVKRINVPNRIH